MPDTKDPFSYIVAIFAPPISILTKPGVDSGTIGTNIVLTLLGWVPGVLHAWSVLANPPYATAYPTVKPTHRSSVSSGARHRSPRDSGHYMVYEPRGYLEHEPRGYLEHESRGHREHKSRHHRERESDRYLAYEPRSYEEPHMTSGRARRRSSAAGQYVLAEKADNNRYYYSDRR